MGSSLTNGLAIYNQQLQQLQQQQLCNLIIGVPAGSGYSNPTPEKQYAFLGGGALSTTTVKRDKRSANEQWLDSRVDEMCVKL